MTTTAAEPINLGADDAARTLGISTRTLWSWTSAGRIPHVRLGRRVLYPVESLRAWVRSQVDQAAVLRN